MYKYRELIVWQKSIDLVVDIYRTSGKFPPSEMYGLTSQIRRSSISISSNIAEGAGRMKNGDFSRFLNIARGSMNELETQLIIAERLQYISKDDINDLLDKIDEIQRMLTGLQKTL